MKSLRTVSSLLVVVLGVLLMTSTAVASRYGTGGRVLMFRPAFRLADRSPHVQAVLTEGRYAFVAHAPTTTTAGILIDEKTGRRTSLTPPVSVACGAAAIGGPWLVFNCNTSIQSTRWELYSLGTGRWQSVPPITCESCVSGLAPNVVGRYWIGYQIVCSDHETCGATEGFENIATGLIKPDPTGGRTRADPNSPRLARNVCDPLTVPTYRSLTGPGRTLGSLSFYGTFAVALTYSLTDDPIAKLERCGSRQIQPLSGPPVGNPRILIWRKITNGKVQSSPLYGLFLPGRQPFKVIVPPSVAKMAGLQLAVSTRHLYLGPWSAALPALPQTMWVHRAS